ncbi:unnamed protein product [Rhizophagus irregularis]|uniref:Uncharacterized protein n=1 Tax=Rhizophagus irregularis TaxID=588596 RepID=A0A916E9A0_9GLOM|nr:hypothetical protein RIR_jg4320.t1 [Rhizophagus irregularis DAOM 181602=DAOM 197198]CAB5364516.1 unnamed protein product [Rhizophagus irregularis]
MSKKCQEIVCIVHFHKGSIKESIKDTKGVLDLHKFTAVKRVYHEGKVKHNINNIIRSDIVENHGLLCGFPKI